MKINTTNNNCAFKSLHFGPTNEFQKKSIIYPNLMTLNNIAKRADVFIKNEDFIFEKGEDYKISSPALSVTVSPLREPLNNSVINRGNSKILSMSYTYLPEVYNNDNNGADFVSLLEDAVDTITK